MTSLIRLCHREEREEDTHNLIEQMTISLAGSFLLLLPGSDWITAAEMAPHLAHQRQRTKIGKNEIAIQLTGLGLKPALVSLQNGKMLSRAGKRILYPAVDYFFRTRNGRNWPCWISWKFSVNGDTLNLKFDLNLGGQLRYLLVTVMNILNVRKNSPGGLAGSRERN